jgi:glutathione S-transferase
MQMTVQSSKKDSALSSSRKDKDSVVQSSVVHLKALHPAPSIERVGVDASMERPVALYHFGPSSCSQKVRLTLAAKGVQWEGREVNLQIDENIEPDYMRINPRGVVPTLIDGEEIVFDSGAIIRYINRNLPGPKLEPEDDELMEVMEHWIEVQDQFPLRGLTYGNMRGLVGKLMRAHQPARIPKLERFRSENPDLKAEYEAKLRDTEHWIEEQSNQEIISNVNERMESILNDLDKQMKGNQWIVGDQYTLADIAWTTILSRIDFLGLDKRMWDKRPAVKAYYERLKETPGFEEQVRYYQSKPYLLKGMLKTLTYNVRSKFSNQPS